MRRIAYNTPVRRSWKSFDPATTNRELLTVPQPDRRALTTAMARFGQGLEGGFVTKDYGNDVQMIKATNRTAGRCLFFTVDRSSEDENLVALLFYKKEADDALAALVEAARERRRRYIGRKR